MTPADDIAQSAGPVRVRLVGPLRVYVDGRRVVDPPAGRAASLLALLAVEAGHLVPIDRIIDDLWPDGAPAKAKENVASLVSRLRRIVGRDRIEGSRSGYRLVLADDVRIDLRDAEAGVLDGRRAATSWPFEREFAERFPAVHLQSQALLCVDEGLITAGAVTSAFELGLHLVRAHFGERVARAAARLSLVDAQRSSQNASPSTSRARGRLPHCGPWPRA